MRCFQTIVFHVPFSRIARSLELTTPCLAAADPPHAELRATALLGALRMWWRATRADRLADSMESLRDEEVRLFGGPADDSDGRRGGTGLFVARLDVFGPAGAGAPAEKMKFVPAGDLAAFLGAAVGPKGRRHEALAPGTRAEFTLLFRPGVAEADRSQIELALDCLLAFGGVGLLSRRGMGSWNDAARVRAPLNEYEAYLRALLARVRGLPDAREAMNQIPTFSEFGAHYMFQLAGNEACDPMAVLANKSLAFSNANGFDAQHMLSISRETGGRHPSPMHLHVTRLTDATVCVASYLPVRSVPDHNFRHRLLEVRILDFLRHCSAWSIEAAGEATAPA